MTPAARVQAAIALLDVIIAAARDGGPPADTLARDFFRERRYMGSGDRRAVRELAYSAIRHFGERPASGRAAMVAMADLDPNLAACFDGSGYGPATIEPDEQRAKGGVIPHWIDRKLPALLDQAERNALLERAPLDIRFDPHKTDAAAVAAVWPNAEFCESLPGAARLAAGSKVEDHALWEDGAIEIQDWGSQLIVAACGKDHHGVVIDLCAGAGGKTLGLAAQLPSATRIIACDISRNRLAQLEPRRNRAGAISVETLLLDPGKEWERLQPYAGQASLVLVDAPCSGTGTWRRNPETRWRLSPQRLAKLVSEQARLLQLAIALVKPGGTLVYAVCSLLPEEGVEQFAANLSGQQGWTITVPDMKFGRPVGTAGGAAVGRLLTPLHDRTDGFFLACAVKS